jgi:hypothetical protein
MTICHFSYRLVLAELKFGPTTESWGDGRTEVRPYTAAGGDGTRDDGQA